MLQPPQRSSGFRTFGIGCGVEGSGLRVSDAELVLLLPKGVLGNTYVKVM